MLTRCFITLLFSLTTLAASANVVAPHLSKELKGDAKAGKALISTCVACHGEDGNSASPAWPKLAEQGVIYLVKQLKEFKKGESGPRYNESMYPMVQSLSEQDMINIATYFSQQKISQGETQKNYLARGQQLYRGGDIGKGISACAACHGPSGRGNLLAKFPSVRSQHAAYTVEQLKKFRSGQRSNGAMMTAIAKRMSDEDMQAVASYMEGLK